MKMLLVLLLLVAVGLLDLIGSYCAFKCGIGLPVTHCSCGVRCR